MSLSSVLYVCVAACLFPAILSAKTAMSRHQLELREHYEHLAKIAEFECEFPQARLLNVHDLLSDFETRGKAYFPEVTVLHRCDRHVGSCNEAAHMCGPTQATPVKMPFKVTFLEDMGGHTKGEWEMVYHSLENHTTCGCLKYEGAQKPPKTAVHYHYIDPSLVPPQTFLPLEPPAQITPGVSSYDVPVYQTNSTAEQPGQEETPYQTERNYTRPTIYDMTKIAEEEIGGSPGEQEVRPDEKEVRPETDEATPCLACTESQNSGYPGYSGGHRSTEPSTANEVRDASTTPDTPSVVDEEKKDFDDDVPSDLVRFGAADSPRFEALTDSDSPYDSYLKQADS